LTVGGLDFKCRLRTTLVQSSLSGGKDIIDLNRGERARHWKLPKPNPCRQMSGEALLEPLPLGLAAFGSALHT